jgi:hypothetical protein
VAHQANGCNRIPTACTRWEGVEEYTYNRLQGDRVLLGYASMDFGCNDVVNFSWGLSDMETYAEMYTDLRGEETMDLRVAEIILTRELFEEIVQTNIT